MTNQGIALIRLGVAAAVAYLVALAAKQGLPALNAAQQAAVVTAIIAVVAPVYTGFVQWLEKRFPFLGHLLLVRYKKGPGTAGSKAR